MTLTSFKVAHISRIPALQLVAPEVRPAIGKSLGGLGRIGMADGKNVRAMPAARTMSGRR